MSSGPPRELLLRRWSAQTESHPRARVSRRCYSESGAIDTEDRLQFAELIETMEIWIKHWEEGGVPRKRRISKTLRTSNGKPTTDDRIKIPSEELHVEIDKEAFYPKISAGSSSNQNEHDELHMPAHPSHNSEQESFLGPGPTFFTNTSAGSGRAFPVEDGLSCKMTEKQIGRAGDVVMLSNFILHFSGNVDPQPLMVTIIETDTAQKRHQEICSAGLNDILKPGMQLRFQVPQLNHPCPAYLQLRNTSFAKDDHVLVLQRNMRSSSGPRWTATNNFFHDGTDKSSSLKIDQFSVIEILGLKTRYGTKEIAARVCGLLNGQHAFCTFYVYCTPPDQFLVVIAETQHSDHRKSIHTMLRSYGCTLIGYGSSKFSLIDQETLLFYFEPCGNGHQKFQLNLNQCAKEGQQFQVPLPKCNLEDLPNWLHIRRKLAESLQEQPICEIQVGANIHLKESITEKTLRLRRVKIIKTLDVQDVLPQLRQDNVLSVREQETLLAILAKQDQAGKLLDIVGPKGPAAFKSFTEALKNGHPDLAEELSTEHAAAITSSNDVARTPKCVPQFQAKDEEETIFERLLKECQKMNSHLQRSNELREKELALKTEIIAIKREKLKYLQDRCNALVESHTKLE